MNVETKIATAKEKKDIADQAFRAGQILDALRSYHEALMYLNGISRDMQNAMSTAPPANETDAKPKTEVDEIQEKIYSNMAACHVKNGNWKRAVETADKALAKNSSNSKALYRKGKALGEQGYFERAERILTDLLKEDSADAPAIEAELQRLRLADKEREKVHNKKFKGFLNREKGEKDAS